jgi:mono/diheme cytochrome c family protein
MSNTAKPRKSRPESGSRFANRTRLWLIALVGLPLALSLAATDRTELRGDPFRGRELLSEKQCTQCHSVWGHGGLLGPDISTAVAGKSWFDLVGDFWNHTPRMIDAMTERGRPWPTLDRGEMADLLSYLYYLRLFDEPGDPARGSIVYTQLQCANCHALGGRGGKSGGPLDRFSAYPSPVVLAQAMWNSGPAMQQEQLSRGAAIPNFAGMEMADLQAYIRAQGLRADRRVELLPLPDPSRGAEVFDAKRCDACHRSGDRGEGPDLASSSLHLTVSEISGILWNHSYAMNDVMQARGIAFPRFEDNELADLLSYLHFLGFMGERGRPAAGESIFQERGCAQCHAGPDAMAVDLSTSPAATDPIRLSTAMWNHAPEMHGLMAEQAVAWPTFDPGDMEHLVAYLRELAQEGKDKDRQ